MNPYDDATPDTPFPPVPMPPRSRPRPARAGIACSALAALALAVGACGGGDESGATTAVEDDSAPAELSAEDFIVALEDEKQAYIEEVVASDPSCKGVETDRDFLLYKTAQITDLAPDEPVAATILEACTG